MVQLSDKQVDNILQRIVADGVTNRDLQNGLLDHYCCFIEEEMNIGSTFDVAYIAAFNAITPNGIHEIQEELFFLLTFKTQTNMKRIIYGSGFLAAFLISTGLMFKTVHWPFGNEILFGGFCALIITSVSLSVNAVKYMKNHSAAYNIRTASGFISAFLISAGSLFKMLYYPGANLQIITGMTILSFVFIPLLFWHMYKQAIAVK